jgi:hypothetical protein
MKLNELICPTCGLKCMTDASYTTCASCNTLFYANQSRSVDSPAPLIPEGIITSWPWTQPQPVTPYITWVGTVPEPTTGGSVGTGGLTDQTSYQVWN